MSSFLFSFLLFYYRYRDVTAFVGLRSSHKSMGEIVLQTLKTIHTNINSSDKVRDEIFCQIIKQICGNNDSKSVLRSWELLLIISSFSPCSIELAPALLSWMWEDNLHANYNIKTRTTKNSATASSAKHLKIKENKKSNSNPNTNKMTENELVTMANIENRNVLNKHENQLVLKSMINYNDDLVNDELKRRTRKALEHSIDRGIRIHAPCIQVCCYVFHISDFFYFSDF